MTEALRIIMHMGEPLPDQEMYEFSIGPLITFCLLTYLFMMYTNGVGASTGMCGGGMLGGVCWGWYVGGGMWGVGGWDVVTLGGCYVV